MSAVVLALDQGTTGTTALVFDGEGRIVGRAYEELSQHYPRPGWVHHDAEEIWRTSVSVLGRALASAGRTGADVRALGITNQRETTVLWDRGTGEAVAPAVVWQSRQTAELCEALRAQGVEPLFRERTGLLLDPYFSGTKVRFLLDADPGLRGRARRAEVLFGTVDAWLVFKLTGGAVHATDPTNASRTLLYDIHRRQWDEDLLRVLDVPREMLPDVRPSAGHFGDTRSVDGLPDGIPITGVAGDQQAALFGQGCWEPGTAKNTYGTGCFLMMNTGERRVTSSGGLLTTLCCDARGGAAYALEGAVFIAGAAIQWLRDEMGLVTSAAETQAVAEGLEDTGGVYVVPAFVGLGAPYWDMNARGAVVGLTRGAGRRHVVRATLESIAYQTRDVLAVMDAESGLPLQDLRVDGGAAQNDFLMQFQADVLGLPVDRPQNVETTATGAAFLAGLGAGLWKSADELRHLRRRERLFVPRMDPARRELLYSGWRSAVERVRTPAATTPAG